MNAKSLEEEALKLTPEDRAKLAERLLLSLEEPTKSEHDAAWLTEAELRAGQLDRGKVEPVPAEEVRRKARELLR